MNRAATPSPPRILPLAFAGLIVIYLTGYLAWYGGTPLGRYPVLDDREILVLAKQIASGTLPAEAFYRAPGYPALLALPLLSGLDPIALPWIARLINALGHLTSTWLVWSTAGYLWPRARAQYAAAALVGFNPVLLHFCGDALDITLGITLMLAGVHAIVRELTLRTSARAPWLTASAYLGLAALVRPQLLALLAALPVIAATSTSARGRNAFASLLPALLVLMVLGAVNYRLAGDFRLLPWQGAYNFWAANRPGAHGRYFEQSIPINSVDEAANTARLESEILYRQSHPAAPDDYRAATAYWQTRTLDSIRAAPVAWLTLLAHKAYYLANNVEQYNNKTYAFHKQRSPWLRWNPLCWSLLFSLGAAGAIRGWQVAGLRALVVCGMAYAGGALLYFVSDRFRVPLVPLLALSAGGVFTATPWPRAVAAGMVGFVALLVSSIPIPEREQTKTVIQDYMALARASSQLGEAREAVGYAELAHRVDPTRPAALALLCVTRFNAWLHAENAALTDRVLESWRDACAPVASFSPAAKRIVGYIEWRAGRSDNAERLWRELVVSGGEERDTTQAWLLLTGLSSAAQLSAITERARDTLTPPMLFALALRGDDAAADLLVTRYSVPRRDAEFSALKRLFDPRH
ncbi:MAG: hypothetical protein HYX63_20700 [Gammaproteobacteria bacterium]|nr:hypothetical protein [Gammaproteobacteria bacterium]